MEGKNQEDLILSRESRPEMVLDQDRIEAIDAESILTDESDTAEDGHDAELGADDPDEMEEQSGQDRLNEVTEGRPYIRISRSTKVKQELIYKQEPKK